MVNLSGLFSLQRRTRDRKLITLSEEVAVYSKLAAPT
jgi:hypothetical protein